MRTRKKPVKRRFLALFLCLSMVISMMNVGGNVWADETEKSVKANTNSEEEIDKKINPTYTLQHYFWFPEVEIGEVGATVNNDQMAIINTADRGVPKDRAEAEKMVSPLSLMTVDGGSTVQTKLELKQMFEDEEVHFLEKPRMIYMNRLYNSDSSIDSDEDAEEHFNKNYTLKEVWVHQPEYESIPQNLTPADEKKYFVVYEAPTQVINGVTRHDPSKFVFTNNPDHLDLVERKPGEDPVKAEEDDDFRHTILIKEGTIIRLIFDTTPGTETVGDNVRFFDYDITSGVIYKAWGDIQNGQGFDTSSQDDNTTYYADAWQKGINSPSNYSDPNKSEYAHYAFGNGSGVVLTGWGEETWTPEANEAMSKYINKANDDSGSIVRKASYGLVEGLNTDGTLKWSKYIDAPAIFGEAPLIGKTNYTDNQFKLIFNRDGGTYTLSAVDYDSGDIKRTTSDNLEYFVSRPTWNGEGILWANDFWPMDIGENENGSWGTDGHDLKFGNNSLKEQRKYSENYIFPKSDDDNDHNPYFGMTFNVDFIVDPGYVAPLRYFFFGDDDMWVFLSNIKTDANGDEVTDADGRAVIDETTTKLIADIGGVHQSIGEYVDLWDYVEQIPYHDDNNNPNKSVKYRLTFFYTERGASGSTCYMRFTLPFQSLVTASPSYENELQIEKIVESTDSAAEKEFAFVLNLYNKYGIDLTNQYYYQRFKRSNVEGQPDEEIGTTYNNVMTTGKEFYLKDGEYIKVKNLPAGTTYSVKELNDIGTNNPTFYTGTIEGGLEDIRIEGNEVSGRVDDEANIELPKINYVTFVNTVNPGVLTLKKQMASDNNSVGEHDFLFNVTLADNNGDPVKTLSWMKYVSDENDNADAPMEKQQDSTSADGNYVFELKAGEKIMLYNLPEGTKYTITEVADEHFPLNKVEVNGITINPNNNTIEGSIEDPTRVNVIFTNTAEVSIEKSQAKVAETGEKEFTTDILTVEKGDKIAYRLTVKNNSKVSVANLTVKDEIPLDNQGKNRLTLVENSITENGSLQNDNTTILWTISKLDPGEEINLEFQIEVTEIEESQRWKNIAILKEPDKPDEIPSNPVELIPAIKIEKTQQLNGEGEPTKELLHVKTDDQVTYYLTVTNTSDTTAFDVEVKDTVPEDDAGNQLELIESSVEGGNSHSISGRTITWKLGDLKAGESRTVQFTIIVPEGGTYWINGGSTSYIPPDPEDPEKPGPEEDRTPDIPSNEVEIEKPGISIQKTQYAGDDAAGETDKLLSVKPGDVITYCLTVTNGLDEDATDVIVTDQIPDGLTLVSGSVSDGGTVGSDGVITWKLGTLEAHNSKKVQFKVTVPQVDKAAKWTNIAYVTSGDPDPDPEEDPKTPSNPVEAIPGIKIEKAQQLNGEGEPTKELLHVKADDQVTYYLTVTNTSDATAFDVEVKDTVPEDDAGNQLELIESSVEGGNSHSISGRTITWKLGDLKAGESRTVQFTVIVPEGGTYWINGGSTSYIPPDPEDPEKPGPEEDRTPDIPSNEVEIEKPEISIRKTQYAGDDAAGETDKLLSVKPGDVITYCLTVTNGSDKDAADVIVTDQIPDGLTLVSGSVSDGGTVGSDRVITWKLGTLEAHDSKKVQFKVTVPQVDKAAKWTNIAYVTSGDPDPDPEEDPKTPSNPVEAIPGIEIEKTQQLNGEGEPTKELLHVKAGDQVTYYLTVTNTSDATAFDVKVTDTIPTDNAGNELQLVAGSVKGGTGHEISGREITWSLGNLNPGDKSTVEFTVTVPAGGTHWINGASANYIPPDPEEPDKPGPEEERTPDIPSNEVEIDKSDADIVIRKLQSLNGGEATKDTLNVKPGDVITYRLAVSNESDNPADDVIVTDPVPAGLILNEDSIVPEGIIGTGQNGQQTITWKLGTLEAGEEKTLEFKVTVPQSDKAAKWTNIAYVTEGDPDPDPEDPKTPSNEVEAVPGIEIEKTQQVNGRGEPTKETLQVQKGDEVTYYLTVTNTSETKAFDVIVTDEIPVDGAGNRLELVEGSVEGGESHKVSGNVITWNIGDLEAGESRQVKFTVKVPVSGSSWKNMASTSYVPGDPEDPEKPGPEEDRTPDIPSNEVEIQAGTTKIQLRARKVLNGAELLNGQFTFRIQGISADITEEAENETQKSETARKPEESEETPEATPSNAERVDDETTDSGNSGVLQGLSKPIGTTITKQVMLQAGTLAKGEGIRVGSYAVPMPSSSTATNNEDGEIVFGEIEYTVPGIYIYKISEVKEMRTGYTFDTTEYTVEVVVSRDEATGELTAEVRIVKPEGADEILFTNRYRRPSSGGSRPGGGGGSNPQPGPGTDPTPDNPDAPDPESPSLEDPQPDTETPGLPDPNDPNSPDRVTIDENGVPRTYVKVWDPEKGEYIYIPEEDVPLYGLLPKTGEEDRRRRLEMILALSLAGVGALTMEERRRRKKEQKSK